MIHLYRFFFLFCTGFISFTAFTKPSFKTILDDTATGEIRSILQDKTGYIWFGSRNSVLRYNAYTFEKMFYLTQTNKGIKKNSPHFTEDIFEDADGDIWVASHSGLFLFNKDLKILERPKTNNEQDTAILALGVHDVDQTPSGKIILGGPGTGIILLNKITMEVIRINQPQNVENGLLRNSILKLLVDSKNRIWTSTNVGLQLFNEESHETTLFAPNPDKPGSILHNALIQLEEHKSGLLIGGTEGVGIYVFDPVASAFKHYPPDPDKPQALALKGTAAIHIDSRDVVWISGSRSCISLFDPVKGEFTELSYQEGEPGSPYKCGAASIFEDKNTNIWLGHFPNGISLFDRSTEAITRIQPNTNIPGGSISTNNVYAIAEDEDKNLWLTVADGVNYLDRSKNAVKRYSKWAGNYAHTGGLSGYLDSNGVYWVGTWKEGYSRYNAQTDKFDRLSTEIEADDTEILSSSVLQGSTIWGFCETKNNELWIATHTAGISRYNPVKNSFLRYIGHQYGEGLTNRLVWTCHEDKNSKLWIATAHGISRMNYSSDDFTNYLPNEENPNSLQAGSVLDLLEDNKGRMWFGTDKGLQLYREKTNDFVFFDKENGFIDHGIKAITQDLAGNLWLGTNAGIIRFNPDTREVKNFTEHAGQQFGETNIGASLSNKQGEIFFGSKNGLIIIDTIKLSSNMRAPPIVFSDFKVFAKSVAIDGSSKILSRAVDRTDTIVLDYKQQMFSFEFAALNFIEPYNNQYAYKLEGFDDEWREIGNERKAQYTNLPSGEYSFKVKAANNSGVWSKKGKSIKIIQLPPPWRTWWAYCIYTSLILLSLARFVYIQKRKRELVEEQNRILEIKVAERTRDLAEKNKDIQAMLSNMKQGLFTIDELGNIHHEYSAYLEEIFETQNITGLAAFDFLFNGAELGAEQVIQARNSLDTILGMDRINFDFNCQLLVSEYKTSINKQNKILSLDWSPITDQEVTTKLMVSVKDITELKRLEVEATEKKKELDIISQLIGLDANKFIRFVNSTQKTLQESQDLINKMDGSNTDALELILRNIHTAKGNSRTLGLSFVSQACHQTEEALVQFETGNSRSTTLSATKYITLVMDCLNEYQRVYSNVLGREETESNGHISIKSDDFATLQDEIDTLKKIIPDNYQRITYLLNKGVYTPLNEILDELLTSLTPLAVDLGKDTPIVIFKGSQISFKNQHHSILEDIFTHILRNALDHGIETPDIRRTLKKNPQGKITINQKTEGERITISITDDGAGLNIKKLFYKGIENKKWTETNHTKLSSIAGLVFESGISTKEKVTDISGRGVGMNAVKQILKQANGNIDIKMELDSHKYDCDTCPELLPFEIIITLPLNNFN